MGIARGMLNGAEGILGSKDSKKYVPPTTLYISRGTENYISNALDSQVCTKRRTKLSIENTAACEKEDVDRVISKVFKRCYRDTAPFPTTPK